MKSEYRLSERKNNFAGLEVGSKVPLVSWSNRDGSDIDLSSLLGTPVIIAFLSSEWDPARSHQLEQFNQALSAISDNVRVTKLESNQSSLNCTFDQDDLISVPVLQTIDLNSDLAREFGVEGKVAIFVLDEDGVIRFKQVGGATAFPSSSDLLEALQAIPRNSVSRRQFVFAAAAALAALVLLPGVARASEPAEFSPHRLPNTGESSFTLQINGTSHKIPGDPRTTLLDALRDRLGMTGTKKGCDHGQCGACTVHMNGRRVNSCLVLAAQAEGAQITTIEGVSHGDELHPVQQAFIEHDGFQCGYCTPGQIMSAIACIREGHTNSKEEIREWMSGNICRCGAYQGILESIEAAKSQTGAKV